ncbi:MAG: hypothetical protein HUJ74_03110 [Lachnospiraceae bacterium]|nr:hypothetical protein [Lachnospiraceae bacterium]
MRIGGLYRYIDGKGNESADYVDILDLTLLFLVFFGSINKNIDDQEDQN